MYKHDYYIRAVSHNSTITQLVWDVHRLGGVMIGAKRLAGAGCEKPKF